MSGKSLLPSMKEKKRYLLLEGNLSKKDVEESILGFIGALGWAKASPVWVTKNVIAVNREYVNEIKGSFVYSFENKKISVKKVSGTLKGLGIKE